MYGPNEVDIQFPTPIPVHLTYQTAFVDGAGKLEFRDDIYGRDRALLALMKGGGEERRVADIPVEHKENIIRRQVLAVPDQPSLSGRRPQLRRARERTVTPPLNRTAARTFSPVCLGWPRNNNRLQQHRSAARSCTGQSNAGRTAGPSCSRGG